MNLTKNKAGGVVNYGAAADGKYRELSREYERIERAIVFLERNAFRKPSLEETASALGLSEFHFQRLFSRWAGISPKRFLQFLTKEYAKSMLDDTGNLLDASWDAGLSGPSRLHDLFVACEAVTPGEYRRKGEGLEISYGFHPSPFGSCMIAMTARGICGLRFVRDGHGEAALAAWLAARWPGARLVNDPTAASPLLPRIFPLPVAGRGSAPPGPLHLYVRGTNFQIQVWQALLRIPPGRAVSYEELAARIGMPRAARAVGNAVGDNLIPFLIPCHRVLRKTGDFGNYGEGPARKKAILGWEAAREEIGAYQESG